MVLKELLKIDFSATVSEDTSHFQEIDSMRLTIILIFLLEAKYVFLKIQKMIQLRYHTI